MKGILYSIKSAPDYFALILIIISLSGSEFYYKLWKKANSIIADDVVLYYEYLPAALIYKDISFSFSKKDPEFFRNKIWTVGTPSGRTVGKMTMGVAVLYCPFILVAHGLAGSLGYPADGYSIPYQVALIISSLVYALAGLFILIRLLRRYFARGAVAITIFVIGLGTNLYFYVILAPAMTHAYSFFLFSLFIWLIDGWVSKPAWKNSIFVGLTAGLIILVRPTNIIILILALLWKVDSWQAFTSRLMMLKKEFAKVLIIGLMIFLVFSPQLLFWKYSTGRYWYYSYGEERFFFNDPVFLKGLLSYRKGWLIYTPVMVFSLVGIIVLYFRQRKLFWPVLAFTLINMYVVWSWWCWWYGGGFGQRALIESYALLSVPLAASIQYLLSKRVIVRTAFIVVMIFLITLNIFQTFQYSMGIIHWDGMTKKAYWDTYIRTKVSPAHYHQIERPDYEAALKGDR